MSLRGKFNNMTPREFFPKMPNEVFDMWLVPIIEAKGWPFTSIDDEFGNSDWKYVFGIRTTLKYWCTCEWQLSSINFSKAQFTNLTMNSISNIIINATTGIRTETANLAGTNHRFWACASFIKENNKLPKPIIVSERSECSYDLIDGYHRLAALAHSKPPKNFEIPVWLVINT